MGDHNTMMGVRKSIKESIKWEARNTVEHLIFRDWKRLRWLVLKDLSLLFRFKHRYAYYKDKYLNDVTIAQIKPYNLKAFYRRLDCLKEILIEKEYFDVPSFIPKEAQVIFDIGANIGEYSLIASRLVGTEGKVIAVEPNPKSFVILERNIKINNIENVLPAKIAITDTSDSKVTLYELENPKLTSIKNSNDAIASFLAKTKTIDDLAKELDVRRIDLLKIDVEGAEVCVLNGALNTVSQYTPKIVVELHTKNLRGIVVNILGTFGYKILYERISSARGTLDSRGLSDYVSTLYLATYREGI